MRLTDLEEIDMHAQALVLQYPRSSFPELGAGATPPDAFRQWARESHQVAADWAYGIETVSDPDKNLDADRLVKNMVRFILEGISPVDEAPEVPAEYWEDLQRTTAQRITLAGFRITDLIVAAADNIEEQRSFTRVH